MEFARTIREVKHDESERGCCAKRNIPRRKQPLSAFLNQQSSARVSASKGHTATQAGSRSSWWYDNRKISKA